jgi:hypothetical protein
MEASAVFLLLAFLIITLTAGAQAQTPQSTPVALSNPGFEEGAAGWNLPPNAAIVTDQAFSGTRSARLTVSDPMVDPVYITRQVPVVGGGQYLVRCRVKTQGVTRKPGRMSSVGAGLIVEWADPQGKWYASGSYATGLYGDNDWLVREATSLRAPEQAGFAVIFLALRGAGTAWFDDVEVFRVDRVLSPTAPASGSSLHANRPRLSWRDDPQAMSYVVELSPDPAFPPDRTVRLETEQAWARPSTPLAPGRWYWRVSAAGYSPTAPLSFDQTAPVDEDTTPPTIVAEPTRVVRADEPVRVLIQSGDAPTRTERAAVSVQARLGDKPLTVALETPQGTDTVTAVLSGQWAPGLNEVTLTAADAAGNADTQTLLVLFRPVPDHPVAISADGAYTDAGERIFPLGMYEVSPQAMATVKQAGIDVVHTYRFESSRDDEDAREFLDAAAAAGLRVFIGFDRGIHSGQGLMQGNIAHVIARVAALCDHPGLFCWYLFDEPESAHQYISPRGLIAYANLIRRLDPYHPVVVTTWGPRMALYRRSFDTHWTQAYTTPAGVVRQIEEHRRLLGPNTPITLLVHCFDREQTEALRQGKPFDPARFTPDGQWMRAAAFAGITQRVNGLWWWWYADAVKDWATVARAPEAWKALTAVFSQLQDLEPILVDPAPAETGTLDAGDGKIYWWRKTVGDQTTLIAVNTTERTVQVTIPAPGDGPAAVRYEDRRGERRGGNLADEFSRYAVHIYQFTR